LPRLTAEFEKLVEELEGRPAAQSSRKAR